jgi:hypothetical protein
MTVAPTPLHPHAEHHYPVLFIAILVIALAGAAALLLYSFDVFTGSSSTTGVQGSGVAASQTRDVSAFSSVELAGANNVTIHVGGKQAVIVHADDNLLGRITTTVRAGNLVIGNTAGSFTSKSPMSVAVSVPSLDALTLAGSGVIVATGIDTASLTASLPGSGVLYASGSATRLDITLSGSGDARLGQLTARDVHAVVSGSGEIVVNPTTSLDATVSGSGTIIYAGNPAHVTTHVTGVGAVTRG